MVTISLCMIVKNEEKVLGRCLDSIRDLVDEIIIVDTGSTDRTVEVAGNYTDKIYDFQWVDDFSAARNYSFSKATMDYQFWLDADDVLEDSQKGPFMALKEGIGPDTDMVTMLYDTHFDSQGKAVLTSTRERLIKQGKGYQWIDPVHECIPLQGVIQYSEVRISHRKEKTDGGSRRNIEIYESLENSGKQFTPRQMYYYARELFDHGDLKKSAAYLEKFLDGGAGWVEDNIASCILLSKCYLSMGEENGAKKSLIRSFEYDGPRPEACCELGYFHKRRKDYKAAAKWFEAALHARNDGSLGFVQEKYEGFIPHIELCVCYYNLGDIKKAAFHNEMAGQFRENDSSVLQNKAFFIKLKEEKNNKG